MFAITSLRSTFFAQADQLATDIIALFQRQTSRMQELTTGAAVPAVLSLAAAQVKLKDAQLFGLPSTLELNAIQAAAAESTALRDRTIAALKKSAATINHFKHSFRTSSRDTSNSAVVYGRASDKRQFQKTQVTLQEAVETLSTLRQQPYIPTPLAEALSADIQELREWHHETASLFVERYSQMTLDRAEDFFQNSSAKDMIDQCRGQYNALMAKSQSSGICADFDIMVMLANIVEFLSASVTVVDLVSAWQCEDHGKKSSSPQNDLLRQFDNACSIMAAFSRVPLRPEVVERAIGHLLDEAGKVEAGLLKSSSVQEVSTNMTAALCRWPKAQAARLQRELDIYRDWMKRATIIDQSSFDPNDLWRTVSAGQTLLLVSTQQRKLLGVLECKARKVEEWITKCASFNLADHSLDEPQEPLQSRTPCLNDVLELYHDGVQSLGVSKLQIPTLHKLSAAAEAWLLSAKQLFGSKHSVSSATKPHNDLTTLIDAIERRHEVLDECGRELRNEFLRLEEESGKSHSNEVSTIVRKDLQPVFCVCRRREGDELDFFHCGMMLCCDRCEQWYHPECIGIPKSALDTAFQQENWICGFCSTCATDAAASAGKNGTSGAPERELYCLCQQPHHENAVLMGCDTCSRWFHPDCVWHSAADNPQYQMSFDSFMCPYCCAGNKLLFYPRQRRVHFQHQKERGVSTDNVSDGAQPTIANVTALLRQAKIKFGDNVEIPELPRIESLVNSVCAWYSDLEHLLLQTCEEFKGQTPVDVVAVQIRLLQLPLVAMRIPKAHLQLLEHTLELTVETARTWAYLLVLRKHVSIDDVETITRSADDAEKPEVVDGYVAQAYTMSKHYETVLKRSKQTRGAKTAAVPIDVGRCTTAILCESRNLLDIADKIRRAWQIEDPAQRVKASAAKESAEVKPVPGSTPQSGPSSNVVQVVPDLSVGAPCAPRNPQPKSDGAAPEKTGHVFDVEYGAVQTISNFITVAEQHFGLGDISKCRDALQTLRENLDRQSGRSVDGVLPVQNSLRKVVTKKNTPKATKMHKRKLAVTETVPLVSASLSPATGSVQVHSTLTRDAQPQQPNTGRASDLAPQRKRKPKVLVSM